MANTLTSEEVQLNVVINGNTAKKRLGELEKEALELSREMRGLNKNTEEYAKKAKLLGEAEDRMEKLRKKIGLTALTTKQLRAEKARLKRVMDKLTPNTPKWKEHRKELDAVEKQYRKVRAGTQRTGKMMSSLKSLLPVAGFGALAMGIKSAATEIFNLVKANEQLDRKAKIVFGESLPMITKAAQENARQMGLTNKEFVHAAANAADLLVPLGFARDESAELSMELTNLSGALSEWSGGAYDAVETNEILTKALLGEAEQIKQLGIVIDQSSKAYNERIKLLQETEGLTKEQARAMDILRQINEKSTDAQAAFNQEANTLLRFQRNISTWWRQLKENVASYFMLKPSEQLMREKAQLNAMVHSLTSVNQSQESRARLMERLQKAYPDFLENLDAEKVTNEELLTRLKQVNEEYDKRIRQMLAEELYQESVKERTSLFKKEQRAIDELDKAQARLAQYEGKEIRADQIDHYNTLVSQVNKWRDSLENTRRKIRDLDEEMKRMLNRVSEEYRQIITGEGGDGQDIDPEMLNIAGKTFEQWKKENEELRNLKKQHLAGETPVELEVLPMMEDIMVDKEFEAWKERKEKLDELKKQYELELQEMTEEYRDEESVEDPETEYLTEQFEQSLEGRMIMLEAMHEAGIISEQEYNRRMAELYKQDKENAIKAMQMKIAAVQTGANEIIGGLTELTEAFARDSEKQAQIMQAVTSFQVGLNQALTLAEMIKSASLVGVTPFEKFAFIAAATAKVLTIFASVKKMISALTMPQFEEGKYDVIGEQDGRHYRAGVKKDARTGVISSPSILVGEKPEIIIDPATTRNLQLNYPEVIHAINMARMPQYAAGSYPEKVVTNNTNMPPQLYALLQQQGVIIQGLTEQLRNGINAKLIADDDYIRTHNDVAGEYNRLRGEVDIGG